MGLRHHKVTPEKMRLFTGISIAPAVLSKIELLLETLRPLASVRWSPAANLHVTTKFIGEWPENRLNELKEALGRVKPLGAIHIHIRGLGFLPASRHPKVFYGDVDGGRELPELAARTNEALAPLGCAPEMRPYRPHLTLARIKDQNVRDLRAYVDTMADTDLGSFEAAEFHLYLSRQSAAGSDYTQLGAWALS